MLGFILGLMVGATIGFFSLSLATIARTSDDRTERRMAERREEKK